MTIPEILLIIGIMLVIAYLLLGLFIYVVMSPLRRHNVEPWYESVGEFLYTVVVLPAVLIWMFIRNKTKE